MWFPLVALWMVAVSACDGDSGDARSDLRGAFERGDGSFEALARDICADAGMPDDCDVCATLDYYGDGTCDPFCTMPDPDCGADAGMDGAPSDLDSGRDASDVDAPSSMDAPGEVDAGIVDAARPSDGGLSDAGGPPPGPWTAPVAITTGTSARSDLCLAQDRTRNAIAVWREEISAGAHGIVASASSLAGPWRAPSRVDAAAGPLHAPACDVAAGDALVAWWSWLPDPTYGRGPAEVWSRRRTSGTWDTARIEESFVEVGTTPRAIASLDESGTGLLVLWRFWFSLGPVSDMRTIHVHRVGGTSWPLCSGTISESICAPPRLASLPSGERFVAWTNGTENAVSGWLYPAMTSRDASMRGALGSLTMGPEGTLLVPTVRMGGGGQSVHTSVAPPAAPFGVEVVNEAGSSLGVPAVAMGAVDEAILVYGSTELRVATYDVATRTWSAPTTIVSGLGLANPTPLIAADASGRAFVVFQDSSAAGMVRAIRYDPTTGWGTPETIETRDITPGTVRLTLTPSGAALVGWIGADGQIWTSRSR